MSKSLISLSMRTSVSSITLLWQSEDRDGNETQFSSYYLSFGTKLLPRGSHYPDNNYIFCRIFCSWRSCWEKVMLNLETITDKDGQWMLDLMNDTRNDRYCFRNVFSSEQQLMDITLSITQLTHRCNSWNWRREPDSSPLLWTLRTNAEYL